MNTLLAILLDLVAVFVFAALGRTSHAEALDAAGVVRTASPFVLGALMGWVVLLMRRFTNHLLKQGLFVLAATVLLGMFFRLMLNEGVQPSFVLVATLALGVLMLGWRLLATLILRRTASR